MLQLIVSAVLLLTLLVGDAAAMLQVRNGGTRFSAEILVNSNFPTTEYTILYNVRYRVDRPNLFQTPIAVGFGPTFNLALRYIVGFDGSCAISCNWAIGDDGSDTYGANAPVIAQWYCQAIRRRNTGSVYEQIFYYNLPSLTQIAQQNTSKNIAWASGTYIKWGAVPWTDFEGMDGAIENAWIFNTSMTTTQMNNQCSSHTLVDSALAGNVYAHWTMTSDGNDTSGNGRHLTLIGGPTEAWFDGTTHLSGGDLTPPAAPTGVQVSWLRRLLEWMFG